jgi:hypothetical protein
MMKKLDDSKVQMLAATVAGGIFGFHIFVGPLLFIVVAAAMSPLTLDRSPEWPDAIGLVGIALWFYGQWRVILWGIRKWMQEKEE